MTRVLLLSTTTGYQTRAFVDAAAELGVELMLATDRCDQLPNPWRDGAVPIRFHREDQSVEALLAAARERPVDGVLVIGDRPVAIAARVAEALGLPGHPVDAARASRDKHALRERLAAAGLPVPWFRTYDLGPRTPPFGGLGAALSKVEGPDVGRREWTPDVGRRTSDVTFPCVLKPISLSASRGVIRANDPDEFVAAWNRILRLLRSKDVQTLRDPSTERLQVEEFIEGREFAVEGLLDRGRLQVLAIFDKPDPLDGPFFEETIYVTPSRRPAEEQQAIVEGIGAAVAAVGLRHGPIHAECRVNARGVFVLEVAARPIGGLCARALRFETPDGGHRSLEALLMAHASGHPVASCRREAAASGVMMIPVPGAGRYRGLDGLAEAEAVPGITSIEITAKLDQELVPLPEGASYPGFIFARGDTPEEVVASLRAAHGRLRFRIARELDVHEP
ncbi:MAG TPA: ATP-grasp domain-containing protein [Vicinamibacterales bacterium]